VTEEEVLAAVVAPRDALITVSSEQGASTFTTRELIMYTKTEWMAAKGPLCAKTLGGIAVDWATQQD
jgi:hypothetical protein